MSLALPQNCDTFAIEEPVESGLVRSPSSGVIWSPPSEALVKRKGEATQNFTLSTECASMHTTLQEEPYSYPCVVKLPVETRPTTFVALQSWEGVVLKVQEDSFWARLVNLSEELPDEEAELTLDEITTDQRSLVREGAVFYWTIGYEESPSRERARKSIIRFRRLPAWTPKELKAAEEEAERLRDSLGWG